MSISNLDDYRWLVSNRAADWLDRAASRQTTLVAIARQLRAGLTSERVHLVLEQAVLRRRGRDKFSSANRMFFTPLGLEQASDERTAAYKAARFPPAATVADLCCGIGGDLMALAARGPAIGADRNPVVALFAAANCHAARHTTADVHTCDVRHVRLEHYAAWHLDPDRRPEGRRTTRIDRYEPAIDAIRQFLEACHDSAVKLAPAAEVPHEWARRAELEWIGHSRRCKQLVAWFGNLARHPGRRSATVLSRGSEPPRRVIGLPNVEIPVAPSVDRYLFEPHAAVLAAKLAGTLATEYALSAVAPGIGYLTGDRPLSDRALAAFRVTDVLPLDLKRVKELLRRRGIGRLEVKKRGVPHDPEQIRKKLRVAGEKSATLMIARLGDAVTAILTERLPEPELLREPYR